LTDSWFWPGSVAGRIAATANATGAIRMVRFSMGVDKDRLLLIKIR
jgi:hypothetical protein